VVYSTCMSDVGTTSHTASCRQGTVSTNIHRKPIGITLVERKKTGFLSVHKTEDIDLDSYIRQSKVS
jgi:hypothetical protein